MCGRGHNKTWVCGSAGCRPLHKVLLEMTYLDSLLLNSSETWPPTTPSSGAALNTALSSLDAQRLAIAYEETSHSNDSLVFHGCNTFWFISHSALCSFTSTLPVKLIPRLKRLLSP